MTDKAEVGIPSFRLAPRKEKNNHGWISWEGFKKVLPSAALLVVSGCVLILGAVVIEQRSGHLAEDVSNVWVALLEKVGEALVIAGAIDALIHVRDWNDYFMERLRDAIMNHSYLERLGPAALKDLIGRAFRAQLDNPSISVDNKAGFLDYFFSDIQKFIGEPFRENIVADIKVQEFSEDLLLIDDNISYTCRESKGHIQREVRWSNDEGEIEIMKSLRISLRRGDSNLEAVLYDSAIPEHSARKSLTETPFQIEEPIKEEDCVDGLFVRVRAKYIIRAERFQYWTMTHLTKNVIFRLSYPNGYEVQTATFGMKEGIMVVDSSDDSYLLRYPSWLLPDTGISWTFNRRQPVEKPAAVPGLGAKGKTA